MLHNIGAIEFATLLVLPNGSTGSGFRIHNSKGVYLITAKHVLYDDDGNLRANSIEVLCKTDTKSEDNNHRISINLKKNKPKMHPKSDVAVIKIGRRRLNKTERLVIYLSGIKTLIKGEGELILANIEDVKILNEVIVSHDIFLIGFPSSLGLRNSPQFDYGAPLLRKGIVANVFKKEGTIILDCPVFFGNSGSPVVQVNKENKIEIIGVVSSYIPYVQSWVNFREPKLINSENVNSGYSVAVSMDKVFELINYTPKPKKIRTYASIKKEIDKNAKQKK